MDRWLQQHFPGVSGHETKNDIEEIRLWLDNACHEVHSGMQWIALIPRSLMNNLSVASIIFRYFYDFHSLPVDAVRLNNTLGHVFGIGELAAEISLELSSNDWSDDQIVGVSPVMRMLRRDVAKLSKSDESALITGESGTGKERTAMEIHRNSARSHGPFVAVNCGSLPRSLILSELFGHEKGSFTGAINKTSGQIELADNGTLFLDEIGDLTLDLQTTLLRFLDQHTIQRVGGRTNIPVNVRIIAATNVDLQQAIANGEFRSDLYYRLNVVQIELPPLRNREGDVEVLARYFLKKFNGCSHRYAKEFSQQALQVMRDYSWPGNVRELINRIRRAVVMCESALVSPKDLGMERRKMPRRQVKLQHARNQAEVSAIKSALACSGNNLSKAATDLGIARRTLYHLKKKHAIQ